MALTKSILTGRVVLPTDAAPINAELVFTLSGLDSEGGDILPPGRAGHAVCRHRSDAGGDLMQTITIKTDICNSAAEGLAAHSQSSITPPGAWIIPVLGASNANRLAEVVWVTSFDPEKT